MYLSCFLILRRGLFVCWVYPPGVYPAGYYGGVYPAATAVGCTLQATTMGCTQGSYGGCTRLATTGGCPPLATMGDVHCRLLLGGAPCRRQKRPDVVNCFMHGSAVVVLLLLPPSFRSVTPRFTATLSMCFWGDLYLMGGLPFSPDTVMVRYLVHIFFRGSVPSLPSCFWE